MGRWLAFCVLLVLLPAAAGQAPAEPGIYNPHVSTPTTMWFHINGFQNFIINTQVPDDRYSDLVERGVLENSGCIDGQGTQTFTSRSSHTWYGYSSPSIVEYDVDIGGKPRIHEERGISYDVLLDASIQPVFTWFLEAAWPEQELLPHAPPLPPPVPDVVVRATIREGDDISVGAAAFNQGEIIARGESDPTLLFGPHTQQNDHVTAHDLGGGRWVYEFTFPLDIQKDTIRRDESFNIRVDAFMDNGICPGPGTQDDGDYMMLDHVLVHSSSPFRPKLEWNIMNPLYIEVLHPQFVGDDLVVHTGSNSPWGSYDVHGDLVAELPGMELVIDGPTKAVSFERLQLKDNTLGHHRHQEAVTAVWIWDYQADGAQKGVYDVLFHIRNDQDTAEAWALATFAIGNTGVEICAKNVGDDDLVCVRPEHIEGEPAPGAAPAVGLALLGALAWLRRR